MNKFPFFLHCIILLGINLSFSSLQAQIDLSLINPTITATSIPAGKIETVSCGVQNSGSSTSPHSNRVSYYLSTDAIYDNTDTLIGAASANAIAANWSVTLNAPVTFPQTTAPGNYYLILVVDQPNFIVETDETNNTTFIAVTITAPRPDFRVFNTEVAPRIVLPGASTTVSYTIVNIGAQSDSVEVGFFLSTDNVYSTNDILIGSTKLDSLVQNGAIDDTTTLTVPGGTTAARYFLIVYANHLSSQPELYRTNNFDSDIFFVSLVLPDLKIDRVILTPDTVSASQSVAVYNKIDNDGGNTYGTNRIGYYLSTDSLPDNSDVFLTDVFVSTLSANDFSIKNTSMTIPSNTVAGDYWLISYADYLEEIVESDNVNNYTSSRLTVLPSLPDLAIQSMNNLFNPFSQGATIPISSTIVNRGAAPSGASEVRYYLSIDNAYDSTDIFIDSVLVSPLNPSQTQNYSFNYTLSNTIPFGGYSILAYVEQADTIVEYNELNNIGRTGFVVQGTGPPDLVVRNIQANATTAIPFGSVDVSADVYNIGQTSAFGQNLGYYWSTDTIFDSGDTYLATDFNNGIIPNGFQTRAETIRIPNVSIYGTYYILFFTDYQSVIIEADETNNVSYLAIAIDTAYKPDLEVIAYQASPDTVMVGNPITFTATIQNSSTSYAPSTFVDYYLSTDTILDARDHNIRGSRIDGLGAYETLVDSYTPSVPSRVPAGDYYVLFHADDPGYIDETNEVNNLAFKRRKVAILGNTSLQPDVVPRNPSITIDSVEVREQVGITIELHNTTFRTVSQQRVGYYWSTDTILDSTDVYLAHENINLLTGSNPRTIVKNITVPTGLPLGDYYVLVFADDQQQAAESNELNNIVAIPVEVILPRPKLSISRVGINPSTVVPGTIFRANCTIKNSSINVGVGAHYVGYYLSSNTVFDSTAIYLGEGYVDSIGINGEAKDTLLLQLPANTPVGTYNLLFYADHRDQQVENGETDNVTAGLMAVTFTLPPTYAPDLVVQSPSVMHTTRAPSETTILGYTIRNIGTGLAFSSSFGIYLSTTNSYNSGMVSLGTGFVSSLPVGNSTSNSNLVMIPAGTPAGNYYILYFADRLFELSESNENNNIASRSITITGTSPTLGDLIVNNPSINKRQVAAGLDVNVACSVRNSTQGLGVSSVGYYLSDNLTLGGGDVFLGSDAIPALTANGSSSAASTVNIPINTPVGDYYILFEADYQNQQAERDEGNNVVALPIRVELPISDLVVQTATLGASAVGVGDFLSVTCRVLNSGAGPAGGSNVGYYLSTTPTYNGNALQLGAAYIQPLGIGAGQSKNYVLPIPTTIAAGNYYLLFYADEQNYQPESNESNNVLARPITILGNPLFQSDLIIERPTLDTNRVAVGEGTTVQCLLRNQGALTANSSTTGYYLSVDTLWDNSDVLIGNSAAAAINSNDTLPQTAAINIPILTPAGGYYVLYVADNSNTIVESNEANNVVYLPLTITPNQADLVVTQVATPTAVLSGNTIIVNSEVKNQGTSRIASTALGYYLSVDTLYDNGDVYLGNSSVDTLNPNDTSTQQATLTIPAATSTGTYYVLFYADYQQSRAELDKTNNINYSDFAVTFPEPDLLIQQAGATPTTIVTGALTSLTAQLKNQGTGAAGNSVVGYYLSTDSLYSTNDILLGTTNNTGLGVNDSVNVTSTVTIPAATTAGNYYILFYADAQNDQTESEENNNIQTVAVRVEWPLSDLEVNNISTTPTTIAAGNVTNLFCIVENNSMRPAGAHRLGYYLTTAPIFTTNAIPLGDTLITAVGGTATVQQSMNVTIPATVAPGNYYILYYIDDQFAITESNEMNNRVYIPVTITPFVAALPDATVQGATVNPNPVVAGGSVNVFSGVYNAGTVTLINSTLGYYLSPTATYNSSTAVFLGSDPVSSLAINTVVNKTASVTIPSNTPSGNYYVLFYADYQHVVTESNENNNVVAVPLTIQGALPDLVVQNPSAVQLNSSLQVSALVVNNSTQSIMATSLGYYLSTDPVYDASDVFLGDDLVSGLAASSNSFEDATWPIPAGTNDGTYYIVFVADYQHVATESEENNNTASAVVQVTVSLNKLSTANWTIYPNPTAQQVWVDLGKIHQEVQVEVYNTLGQLVTILNKETAQTIALDLEGTSGMYLLKITTKEGAFEGVFIRKE